MKEQLSQTQKEYLNYLKNKEPKTPILKSLIMAFLFGGLICIVGQSIHDGIIALFPGLYEIQVNSYMLIILIFITILLTGIGVWDEVGYIGGAGTFLPISGFANAIASPAIEFKNEGIVFGTSVKMFVVAGPIIVTAVIISVVTGLIYTIF